MYRTLLLPTLFYFVTLLASVPVSALVIPVFFAELFSVLMTCFTI
jgi:hypothetical protein